MTEPMPRDFFDTPPSLLEKIEGFYRASQQLTRLGASSVQHAALLQSEAYRLIEQHYGAICEQHDLTFCEFCESICDGKTRFIPDQDADSLD
ncbi:MAG: hypothetical protein C9356_11830 [Oleiphilus sp.]|nr:MAG: hypothetical protein C9356_11830 [Oleiphilus sp.]